jgi:hypothetical protein
MLKYFYRDGVWSMVVRGAFLEFLGKRFGGEERPERTGPV